MLSQCMNLEIETVGLKNSLILQQDRVPVQYAAILCACIINFHCGLEKLDFLAGLPEELT
jgi:hypothetical protein